MIRLNIFPLLVAFYKFLDQKRRKTRIFIQKWPEHILLMTSYLVMIATDCCHSLPKCVSRLNEELLKSA